MNRTNSIFLSKCLSTFLPITLILLLAVALSGCDAPSDSLDVQGESSELENVVTAESMGYEIEMTDLGPGTPGDINNAGQVVGTKEIEPGVSRGFLWEDGDITYLEPLPGGTSSSATAINNNGRVLGKSDDVPITWKNGNICKLCALEPGYTVLDINDKGQILGYRRNGSVLFILKNKKITNSNFDFRTASFPFGNSGKINNNGIVAGTREISGGGPPGYTNNAYRWRGGINFRDLRNFTAAYDLNDKNQIVGLLAGGQAFLWEDDGEVIELGTLGGTLSGATGINNKSQVVGVSETSSGELHIFLWDNETMIDLGIDLGESVGLESVDKKFSINDNGQILGEIRTRDDEIHIVLLEIKKG